MKQVFNVKKSLTAKLLALFILMAIILGIVAVSNIALSLKHNFKNNVRPHLVQYLEYIMSDIGTPPDIEKAKLLAARLPIEVSIVNEHMKWSSNNEFVSPDKINYYRESTHDGLIHKMGDYNLREYLVITEPSQTFMFSISHPHEGFELRHFVPLVIITFLLVVFYFLIRRVFQPVHTIQQGIKQIGQGELQHRIKISREDELGALANSINHMADDINQMLDAKRQLLLAISHELRTPVTRAKVAVEMLDDTSLKTQIDADLNEIETLTEEVLETERLSARHQVLHKQSIMLESLLSDVIKQYFPDNNIEFVTSPTDETALDAPRIKLLMRNLIGNAIQHSKHTEKPPIIFISQQQQSITFIVQDFGNGVSDDHIPHLTEPFYRVDPSRRKETGGYGLGLYLCRIIAEAHGGSLLIKSKLDVGTEVIVTLPVSHSK